MPARLRHREFPPVSNLDILNALTSHTKILTRSEILIPSVNSIKGEDELLPFKYDVKVIVQPPSVDKEVALMILEQVGTNMAELDECLRDVACIKNDRDALQKAPHGMFSRF